MKFNTVMELATFWYTEIKETGEYPFPENELNSALRAFTHRCNKQNPNSIVTRATGKIADRFGYMNEGWS